MSTKLRPTAVPAGNKSEGITDADGLTVQHTSVSKAEVRISNTLNYVGWSGNKFTLSVMPQLVRPHRRLAFVIQRSAWI